MHSQNPSEIVLITLARTSESPDRWAAHVDNRLPPNTDVEADSFHELLQRVPSFDERQWEDKVRLRVAPETDLFELDVLSLLHFNQGSAGLDISGCNLWHLNLSRDEILKYRQGFSGEHGYDPYWWAKSSTRGIDLIHLIAQGTTFYGSDFSGGDFARADLQSAVFWKANLANCRFDRALMNDAEFDGADLRDARLFSAQLNNASFSGLEGVANLNGASIYRAKLNGANLDSVSLQQVTGFGDETDLSGALLWRSNLASVSLEGLDRGSLNGAYLYLVTLDRTPMRRDHLGQFVGEEVKANRLLDRSTSLDSAGSSGDPEPSEWLLRASEAYRSLKSNFTTLGRTDDASWAHYMERRALGRHYWEMWRETRNSKLLRSIVLSQLYRYSCGYGERPLRPLALGGIIPLVFAVLYYGLGFLTGDSFTVMDALIYSGGAFFTLSFDRLQVACWTTELLTVVESALGIIVIGLFLWTIGNAGGRS